MGFLSFERYLTATETTAGAIDPEEQNTDYESGRVEIDGQWWRIRTARITPTKPGAFVAVWRRNAAGETEPFTDTDACVGLLVFVTDTNAGTDADRHGVFAFTREHLAQLRITEQTGTASTPRRQGKRGFRVYPGWCTGLNPQASRMQRAQLPAFREFGR
ncbi:MepB family protein [Leucobacter sp. cx-328]|uniref:MepB family protein n=1 Tax=unclassified Leucobacter TaxID=2621730 RepID=UPI00165DD87C|nr:MULTISPECIES: MepB family protein [unclassified Leucobacter]MBC9943841.1 MepB family protein [Leucobacter sp. cx-328]